jgi:hypothetical protein
MGEASLLARVTAAAHERYLAQNTLIAYRRTWLRLIAWSAAKGLALQTSVDPQSQVVGRDAHRPSASPTGLSSIGPLCAS